MGLSLKGWIEGMVQKTRHPSGHHRAVEMTTRFCCANADGITVDAYAADLPTPGPPAPPQCRDRANRPRP